MDFLPTSARRVVVKLGTGVLTSEGAIDDGQLAQLAQQVVALRETGLEVLVVSSGAVGLGMDRLGLARRPSDLATLQACAAVGQAHLIERWQKAFDVHGVTVAQVVLTHEDVRERSRHVAVMNTLDRLLALGTLPIINENDTVSADEIKFGDNDMLSALVAVQTKADLLVILSTIEGLLDDPDGGQLIPIVEAITPEIEALAQGTTSATAVGGMRSKLLAAQVATGSGCGVFIGSGRDPVLLLHLLGGRPTGTFFVPETDSQPAKKRWMIFFGRPRGRLQVDAGAAKALREDGRSLLAKGIRGMEGSWRTDELVDVVDSEGITFARGLVAFASEELASHLGESNAALEQALPGRKRYEVVHRNSLVLLPPRAAR